MDKYDYITATTLEEKVRLEKLIKYMEDNNIEDNLLEYKERYNNICKYLVAKDKYLNIEKDIDENEIQDYLNQKQDILINSGDSVTEYKYEFDMVTDEDVKMPDLSEYEIERKEN